jgi:hypothetical protein
MGREICIFRTSKTVAKEAKGRETWKAGKNNQILEA